MAKIISNLTDKDSNNLLLDSTSIVHDNQKLDEVIEEIEEKDIYSEEEHIVGTWIDGRAIYEKTIYIESLPNTSDTKYEHGIENAEVVWCDMGKSFIFTSDSNTTQPMFYIHGSLFLNASTSTLKTCITLWNINTSNFSICTGADKSSFSAYITLNYIKTTD